MTDPVKGGPRSPEPCASTSEHDVDDVSTTPPPQQAAPASAVSEVSQAGPLDLSAAAGHDSALEKLVRDQLNHLEPGESVEVELGGEVFAKLGAKSSGKAKVSREEDGTFKLELETSSLVGVGLGEHVHVGHEAGYGAVGAGGFTVSAGTTFHFENAAQAAGFVDAAASAGLSVQNPALSKAGEALNLFDSKNPLSRYAPFVEKVGLSAGQGFTGKVEVDFNVAAAKVGFKAAVDAKVEVQVEYDREKHALILRSSASLSGTGAGFAGAAGSATAKGTLIVERELPMSAEDFKRCGSDSRALAAKVKEALTAAPHVLLQVEGDANITGAHAHSVLTTNLTTGESKATLSVSELNAGGALGYGPAEVEAWARKSREFQSISLEGCLKQSRDFQQTRDELERRMQAAHAARP